MTTQSYIEGVSPSRSSSIADRQRVPLCEKVNLAVAILRFEEPEDGYYLAYSGGKDSGVILELAKMAGVKFTAHYNVTTIDPPEVVRFIKKNHPYVVFNQPRTHMVLGRMVEKNNGPPTRLARWCCAEYKEKGGDDKHKIIGVRAAESPRRAATWVEVTVNRRSGKKFVCPILYWTDEDVWAFHKKYNVPYCELYDEGFKRLGCIGCPLGGPKNQAAEFKRWPKYEAIWKRGFKMFWEKNSGTLTLKGKRRWFEDFGSWEKLWEWWVSGGSKDDRDLFNQEACQQEIMFTNADIEDKS